MRRILVVSTYGHHNSGDDAQALSVAARLGQALRGVEISMSQNYEGEQDQIHGCVRNPVMHKLVRAMKLRPSGRSPLLQRLIRVWTWLTRSLGRRLRVRLILAHGWIFAKTGLLLTRSRDLRDVLVEVRRSDLFYMAGGGNWNDIWLWEGMIARMILVRFFGYFRKPIVISGQGIGPLDSRYGGRLLRSSLRHVDTVTLRDRANSEAFLRRIGVRGPTLRSVGDDSLGLEPAPRCEAEDVIAQAGLDPGEAIFGLQVRLTTWHTREVLGYAEAIAAIADHLVGRFGVKVLLIPSEFKLPQTWDDRDHCYHVRRLMSRWREAAVIHSEITPAVCKALPQCCLMFLATAYHPSVFAIQAPVPVISLYAGQYHSLRIQGLYAFYDLPECAIPYGKAAPDRVGSVFQGLLDAWDTLSRRIQAVNRRMRDDIDGTVTRTAELLRQRPMGDNK